MASDFLTLNFLKLDPENSSKLVEDMDLEHLDLISSITPFETANIDGMLLRSFKSYLHIPSYQDLLKCDIDQAKILSKLIGSDKRDLNENINRLLSIDFRKIFIFNKLNLINICNILIHIFGELKKYKISTFPELEAKIQGIDFSKYNFEKTYLKNEYIENRQKSPHIPRENRLNSVFLSKLTIKELDEDWTEIDDNINYENKYYGKKNGISYIDNKYENYIYSSFLTKDYNYDEEQMYKKLLNKKCFDFNKNNKDDSELPLELILLLYKLKDIKTLIFQIRNADELFIKLATFILINMKWLFNQIEEIKFDINDSELQNRLYLVFNKRVLELYEDYHKPKHFSYYIGNHISRKNNFWVPEGDIIFEKVSFNKNNNPIYNNQPDIRYNTYDNTLCNIYNEYGFITNFKYIRPFAYTMKSIDKLYSFIKNQSMTNGDDNKLEKRPSININNNMKNSIPNAQMNQKNININERTTTDVIKDYMKNNSNYFQLIALYCYFLANISNLKKLSLYFDFSYSLEIQFLFSLSNAIYDHFNFLIFANNINTLTEANFSFNCLDSNSFENILGIIKKNKNLTSLKMSLFSPDIYYSECNLFYMWSEKKLSLNRLFKEQKELLIKTNVDLERNLIYFILHNNKIINNFTTNFRNFFNLLKFEKMDILEEIILRMDIPIPILSSEKYKNIIVKFIINLLITLTIQKNKIKTFKIIAPELPFDARKMPLIHQFFKEIGNEEEHKEKDKEKKDEQENKKNVEEKKNQIIKGDGSIKDKIKVLENSYKASTFNDKNFNKDQNILRAKKLNTNQINDSLYTGQVMNYELNKKFKSKTKKNLSLENISKNTTLEDITLNLKFYNLPEIYNIIDINNHTNIRKINLGFLDQITFTSFIDNYKKNSQNLKSLTSLKISLCSSVISYSNIDKYIIEYINIDTPVLEEKYLFSNLKIETEEKMDELITNVYYIAKVHKLAVQIGNNSDNINLLNKADKKLKNDRDGMYTLRMIMDMPKYKKIRVQNIIDCLASFYSKKENRIIICKENPDENFFE